MRLKRAERGVFRYFRDDWSSETFPVNVFLVEHPDGLCLVDAGQTAAAAEPGYFPRWYPFFRLSRFELRSEDEVAAQLEARGIEPDTVRWVVLTHMHTDHAGGIPAFRRAEVLVAREEWERAQGLGGKLRGYLPQYWPEEISPRLVDFTGPAVGPFPASYDVAGDGTLLLVPFPGHTPGHAGLLVRTPRGGFLCGGDAVHSAEELEREVPTVASYCEQEGIVFLACHDSQATQLISSAERP